MKEYRLATWPELTPEFQRTGFKRILSVLSQRHLGLDDLAKHSGLSRKQVQHFVEWLNQHGVLDIRDRVTQSSNFLQRVSDFLFNRR